MIRTATVSALLLLAALSPASAWQQRGRIAVAVPVAEIADTSLKVAATRMTEALRSTVTLSGHFGLYDTVQTYKSTMGVGGARQALRLPTRYVCLVRITVASPGWAQVTISFVDGPLKDPVVRLASPVLIRSDSSYISFARLAWERLLKAERKRVDAAAVRPM